MIWTEHLPIQLKGLQKSVQYALEAQGIKEENLDNLTCYIGPPLDESFQEVSWHDKRTEYRKQWKNTGRDIKIPVYMKPV